MNQLVKKLNSERCSLSFPKIQRSLCASALANTFPLSSDTLYGRLRPGLNPQIPVTPVLDKWVAEGRRVELLELKEIVNGFRKYRHHTEALKIVEWASDQFFFKNSTWCKATRLKLIARVHGMEKAENYFSAIPDYSKGSSVYGVLLNCYVKAKSLEKAEAIMEKIKKFGKVPSINYSAMLKLYSEKGKHDKRDTLMQEMEDKGVAFDEYMYTILLNAYASASDVKGMEKLLMKMDVDPLVTAGHHTYMVAAKGYMNASSTEKAVDMLKKAEHSAKGKDIRDGYRCLMTYYATMSRKEDVYHLWNHLKEARIFTNNNYLSMVSSLLKLGDIDGAHDIFEEWDKMKFYFDNRIPNLLIFAYCKEGNAEKANSIVNKLIASGHKPNASTWSRMARGYCKADQMENAVEMTKRAFLSSYPSWKPDMYSVSACVEYLKKKGDLYGAEQIMGSLENFGGLSGELKGRVDRYINRGKPDSEALNQVECK